MSDISNDDLRPNGHGCGADHASINHAVANKANAQKSTGPRTEAGTQRSKLNALRHGSCE